MSRKPAAAGVEGLVRSIRTADIASSQSALDALSATSSRPWPPRVADMRAKTIAALITLVAAMQEATDHA